MEINFACCIEAALTTLGCEQTSWAQFKLLGKYMHHSNQKTNYSRGRKGLHGLSYSVGPLLLEAHFISRYIRLLSSVSTDRRSQTTSIP